MTQHPQLTRPASLGNDPIVLYFHHVGKPFDSYLSISTEEFTQLVDLVCTVADEYRTMAGSETIDFQFTFDDGYRDTLHHALPVLESRGLRSTLFVNSSTIGRSIEVNGSRRPYATVTWSELVESSRRGHSIGAHGYRHARWDSLNVADVDAEVAGDLRCFDEHLGLRPSAFAFPYGVLPPRLPTALESYECFATANIPAAHRHCRPGAIRRVYLPARQRSHWEHLVRSWLASRWDSDCQHCHCNTRAVGRAATHA